MLDELLNLRDPLFDQTQRHFEAVSLTSLLNSVAEKLRPVSESRGLELTIRLAPDVNVRGSERLLAILFENLLENAIKYTPEGAVTLTLETSGKTLYNADPRYRSRYQGRGGRPPRYADVSRQHRR